MEFYDVVKARRSIRRYKKASVPREVLERILNAAKLAPSAENVQPWSVIVLDDEAVRQEICRKAFNGIYMPSHFAVNAPVLLVLLAKPSLFTDVIGSQVRGVRFYLIDMGIFGEHIVLAAANEGLGSCWVGWFNEKWVRKALKIDRSYKIVSLMALGYPEKVLNRDKKRKTFDEIVKFNKWK